MTRAAATLAAAVLLAACSRTPEPIGVESLLDPQAHPFEVRGVVTELGPPALLTEPLTAVRLPSGVYAAPLPWPAVAGSLALSSATELLSLGDAARFARGEVDAFEVPSRRRVDVGDGPLSFAFPTVVDHHTLRISTRATGSETLLGVRVDGVTLVELDVAGQDQPRVVATPLELAPGLRRIELDAVAVEVEWVELEHAGPDFVVLRSAPPRLEATFTPVPPQADEVRTAAPDGRLAVLATAGPLSVEAIAEGASVEALPPVAGSALRWFRVEGDDRRVRARQPAAALSALASDAERALLDDAPGSAVDAGHRALVRADVGGDRRAALWLPTASSASTQLTTAPGDRLRFAVGVEGDAANAELLVAWRGDPLVRVPLSGVTENWQRHEVAFDTKTAGPGELTFETMAADPHAYVSVAVAEPRVVHARPDARPNVLVYLVDTLRADHLSCYGARNPTSPNVDRLAREGFRFDAFRAVASWTRPTTATLLTGYYPDWHQMGRELPLPRSLETLAESFQSAGYSTWAAVANPQVGGEGLRFAQGFDRFVDSTGIAVDGETDGRVASSFQLNRTVLPWLEADGDEPFFLYLHSLDPHTPYDPPDDAEAPFGRDYDGVLRGEPLRRFRLLELADQIGDADRRYVEDVYDNEIHYQDARIGELFAHLERLRLADETVVVVLSDHGEEFLEHGEWNHGYRMWEELLRVPLVVWLPPALRAELGVAPRVVTTPVSQVDFAPGLLELVGIDDRFPRQGRSWLPLLHGREADLAPFFGEDYQAWEGDEIGAFQSGSHKLIWRRFLAEDREELELYDLASDPGEQRDLADERPEVLANLRRQRETFAELRALVQRELRERGYDARPAGAGDAPVELGEAVRAELERLGYVEGD